MAGHLLAFEPGARTAWHVHPLGQTLPIVQGPGRAQREGGPVEEVRPGDVVRVAPDERHRHGAAAAMTHVAVQEDRDGSAVTWMEHLTDEQVGAAPAGPGAA